MADTESKNEPDSKPWDRDRLADYVVEKAVKFWGESKEPYLLSYIAPDLTKIGVSYKEILGPIKLKDFLSEDTKSRLNIVSHSLHRAKVGVVPAGVAYRFPDDHIKVIEGTADAAGQKAILAFVDVISAMDDDALENWNIPASVIKRIANPK
ncbi:hypothetical protein [Brevundimonas sp. SL161]|uniref:hypothetical protein n=1 Tax=Brevundimonas sp. SL161 TaxID=2804613 RepID=UPI003CF8DA42